MKPVRIAGLAQAEVQESCAWYNEQSPGLGDRFLSALDLTFAAISRNPQMFQLVHEGTRRALVRSFPYGVFFVVKERYIRIIAVVHLRRHPDTWKRRTTVHEVFE